MTKLYVHNNNLVDLEFRNLYAQKRSGQTGPVGLVGPAGSPGIAGLNSPIKVLQKTLVTVGYLQTRGNAACPYEWVGHGEPWPWVARSEGAVASDYLNLDKIVIAGYDVQPDGTYTWEVVPVFPILNSPVPILILRAYIHIIEQFNSDASYDYNEYIPGANQTGLFLYIANELEELSHRPIGFPIGGNHGMPFAWSGPSMLDYVAGQCVCPLDFNYFANTQRLRPSYDPRPLFFPDDAWFDGTSPYDTRRGLAWGASNSNLLVGHKICFDDGFQTFHQPGYGDPSDAPDTPWAGGAAQLTIVYREIT